MRIKLKQVIGQIFAWDLQEIIAYVSVRALIMTSRILCRMLSDKRASKEGSTPVMILVMAAADKSGSIRAIVEKDRFWNMAPPILKPSVVPPSWAASKRSIVSGWYERSARKTNQ
jgi:hypothetical protein